MHGSIMQEPKPTREQIQGWMRQAESDLRNARHIIEAAEKMLKAVYIAVHRQEASPIHDLADLLDALDAPGQLGALSSRLTADYIMTRYPDATATIRAEAYGPAQAEDRLRRAEEMVAWARRRVEEASDAAHIRPGGAAFHRRDIPAAA